MTSNEFLEKNTIWLLGFVSLGFYAVWVRFYLLGKVPVSLYWDEAAMLADARFLAQTGRDIHGQSWLQAMFYSYGDYKLPVYIWLAAVFVKLFGVSRFALRLPSALAGLTTILLSLLIGRELYASSSNSKKLLALSLLLPIAVSPWAVMFSRTGFEGHVGQMFLGIAVLLLIKAKKQLRPAVGSLKITGILLVLAAQVAAAVSTYSYFSVRFVWPIVFLAGMLLQLRLGQAANREQQLNDPVQQPTSKHQQQASAVISSPHLATLWQSVWPKAQFFLIKILLPLAIYGLLLLPMINSPYYEQSNQFRLSTTSILNMKNWALESNILRAQTGNNLFSRFFYHRHLLLLRELAKNYADNLSLNFLFISGDPNLRHSTAVHGLFLLPFLPVLFIGLYQLWKKQRQQLFFLLAWWMTALLPASVPEETPHALRSLNALLPLSLILGYGTHCLGSFLLRKNSNQTTTGKSFEPANRKCFKPAKILLLLIWGLWLLFSGFGFSHYYFKVYPSLSAKDWQAGYKQAAEKACAVRNKYQQLVVSHHDERFHLWLLAYCDLGLQEGDFTYQQSYHHQLQNIEFDDYGYSDFKQLDENKALMISNVRARNSELPLKQADQVLMPLFGEEYYLFAK